MVEKKLYRKQALFDGYDRILSYGIYSFEQMLFGDKLFTLNILRYV